MSLPPIDPPMEYPHLPRCDAQYLVHPHLPCICDSIEEDALIEEGERREDRWA